MRLCFSGMKTISGCAERHSAEAARLDYEAYVARLTADNVSFTVAETGDDYFTLYLVENAGGKRMLLLS